MDHISEMSSYCQATEGIGLAVMGVLFAEFAIGYIGGKHQMKKHHEEVAKSQNEYFEKHNIEESQRAGYGDKVYKNVCADVEKTLKLFATSQKSKDARYSIYMDISNHVKEYVNGDEGDDDIFEPRELKIKFGVFNGGGKGYYEMVNVDYTGKGFIPDDNLWELGSNACYEVMKGFAKTLSDKYAEEIACSFVDIELDHNYATLQISK